ncbi:MAG: GspH/FimT family pseudopilin [Burkholderiales bacterium]|nr:GspH/FimT family pseudopilin [Burkholderiales bacterium]
MKHQKTATAGFSLIELMVTISVFAIIATISIPNISDWINKAKIRTSAEALQNSIRFAQSEATKRNRLVEFSLVNSTTPPGANAIATNNGTAWIVRVVPFSTEAVTVLQADVFSQGGIQLKGGNNKTLVFDGVGQVYTSIPNVSDPDPVLPTARAYQIVSSGDKYSLCVLTRPGGGVRWCDPFLASGDRSCPGSATQSCL